MQNISLRQKVIALAGQTCTVLLADAEVSELTVVRCPDDLTIVSGPERTECGWTITLNAGERRLAYAPLVVRIAVEEFAIPTRIFGEKEAFLCMVTTSNFHWGHAPQRVGEMEAIGKGWPDLQGDPLLYHGHAYASSRIMAEGAHKFGLPMTWLIDGNVAEAGAAEIARWHGEYGDDVGLLPTSYYFENAVNYNTDKTLDETVAVLENTRMRIERAFIAAGWPMRPQIAGVDQWVGGLGTQWIKAGQQIGLRAFWGICHDHETCDTSMFHEGAPWECYRMQPDNFRYPSTAAGDLWAFPWTARDEVNTFLEYPGASAMYSTDPDDITGCGILANQPDYWDRIVNNTLANLDTCDMVCFVIHNEDHDAHRAASEEYLEQFYPRLPEHIVPATLEEVLQWMELRFPEGTHPAQLLELDDPLTCHDAMAATLASYPWVTWTPPAHWKSVNGHNPSVLCYYGADARWAAFEGARTPAQYIDYTKPVAFQETGVSPKEPIPVLTDWQETLDGDTLRVTFTADRAFPRLPLIFWDRPELLGDRRTARTRVVYVDVCEGVNAVAIRICSTMGQ